MGAGLAVVKGGIGGSGHSEDQTRGVELAGIQTKWRAGDVEGEVAQGGHVRGRGQATADGRFATETGGELLVKPRRSVDRITGLFDNISGLTTFPG